MFSLPQTTEISHSLLKKAIFDKFKPSPPDRQRFDKEIQHHTIINEVSPAATNIAAGKSVSAFYEVLAERGVPSEEHRLAVKADRPKHAVPLGRKWELMEEEKRLKSELEIWRY